MTETVNGTTASKGKSTRKGLRVNRINTTKGVHPYDQVTWERRDVVMTNWRDGTVNFEQRGVEYPEFWSVNAANIVTTKYFRGAVGTPQREWSLKQLVDRVVGVYVAAGREYGYFASEADAEVFDHELKYALIHQIFSFNSPVWFNVGTASPQQVSACFILAVDDTMDSILDWYREEGLIFKGGSGAGVNLSRLRSSKELLSSGAGTASIKLYDAQTTTLKAKEGATTVEGTSGTFTVKATNLAGTGPASAPSSPVVPSSSSRTASACPACRAVSLIRCSSTQRRSVPSWRRHGSAGRSRKSRR